MQIVKQTDIVKKIGYIPPTHTLGVSKKKTGKEKEIEKRGESGGKEHKNICLSQYLFTCFITNTGDHEKVPQLPVPSGIDI